MKNCFLILEILKTCSATILERINQLRANFTWNSAVNAGRLPFMSCRAMKLPTQIRLLKELKDQVEIVIAINANTEHSKVRGDLSISYDQKCCANWIPLTSWIFM